MGTKSTPFCGVLDGEGHILKNFVIQGEDAQGPVGYLKQGSVKFLYIENATISGKTNTGSVVGINDQGLIMGCISSAAVKSTGTSYDYTLLCQNVRYSNANDPSPNSVEERIPRMKTFLKKYAPDIVGFQEYDSVWKTPIESVLTGYSKQCVFGNTNNQTAGTPLYWNSSKFSALEKGTFWLTETPDVMSVGWGSTQYRTCTFAVLKVKSNGMLVIAANAHLDTKSETSRVNGINLIMNRMNALKQKYAAKGYNEIYFHLTGDFNTQASSDLIKNLSTQLTEARYAAVTLGTDINQPTYSAYKEKPTSLGDFMFISNNVDVPFYKVALDKVNGYAVSDHYGLYGELRIGGNSHGGIVGENHGVVLSCAYTGTISTTAGSAGIAAENTGHILNSYSQYTGTATGVFANAITPKYGQGRTDFCYYPSNSGLAGAGSAVADLKTVDMLNQLNRLLSLWVRKDAVHNGLPFICRNHTFTYTDQGDGSHIGVCSLCDKSQGTEPHTMTEGVCTFCGAPDAPIVDEAIVLRHSLNLASDISINYAVEAAQLENYHTFSLRCQIPIYEGNICTDTTTVELLPERKGNYYYFTLTGLTAVQINDTIEATLTMTKGNQAYISQKDYYSVAAYAYAQLNKDPGTAPLKRLCGELLRYGAKTQLYKGYRTDAFADSNMTEVHKAYLSDLDKVTFGNHNQALEDLPSPAVTWVGKALDLNSKVTVKYIFSLTDYQGSIEDLRLHVTYSDVKGNLVQHSLSGAKVYNAAKGWYAFDFDSLLAAELRSVISAGIYSGSTQVSTTMVYSADTYANGKTGNLLTLCKALFAYSDSAKAFFHS